MKYESGYRSADVEDRRGKRVGVVGGGIGVVVTLIVAVLFGPDVAKQLGLGSSGGTATDTGGTYEPTAEEEELVAFVGTALDSCQDTWTAHFEHLDEEYERAKLVLFNDRVRSACGIQGAATGPFYCPGDRKAYIDLAFYKALRDRLGAPGDFAQAYVIAHEIGHHVQNLRGTSARVSREERAAASETEANAWSVRLELQADCYAGVWAHAAREGGLLDVGDIDEALGAAAAIGDDTLQKRAGKAVQPESWTHGSSEQRVAAFRRGLDAGSPDACPL